jgi:UDP-N-acetyl-D-mannosaminuronic acid dehydrogenase
MKVAVVGGAGHVGIPFSIVVASAGHNVVGYDLNEDANNMLNSGELPFIEIGAKEPLNAALATGKLFYTSDINHINDVDVIAIMLGTPVDAENNPVLDGIVSFVTDSVIPRLHTSCGKMIILRSTVAPGTTELLKNIIEKQTGLKESEDFFLVFCPERVAQTLGVKETPILPQLIGAFTLEAFMKAEEFFQTFVLAECFRLDPKEAEFGKLMTNMYRYVNFALANEFYILGRQYDIDIHTVIAACNYNYPRMQLASPGPNVGGPCLFKDGRFLTSKIQFNDLISNAFSINEGMPRVVLDLALEEAKKEGVKLEKIGILGMTFKAECDDTRNSLSYKLKKLIKLEGMVPICYDAFMESMSEHSLEDIMECDAVILMTPHSYSTRYDDPRYLKDGAIVVDVWKLLEKAKRTKSGVFISRKD